MPRKPTSDVRVLIIRGSGGAFAAGTDISQFRELRRRRCRRRLRAPARRGHRSASSGCRSRRSPRSTAPPPAAAARSRWRAICAICSDRAKFGVPVSRTLGNCLSMANTARMVDLIGPALTRDLLLTGRMIDAQRGDGRRPGQRGRAVGRAGAGNDQDRGRAVDARAQHDRRDQGDAAAAARSSPSAGGSRRRHHPRVLWLGRIQGRRRRVSRRPPTELV